MPVIVDAPTARVLPDRKEPARAFIIHGTGETDLKRVLRYYRSADGLCPHYLITPAGAIYGIADEGKIAYHAATGKEEAALYRMGWANWSQFAWNDGAPKHLGGEFTGYRDWRETWFERGYQSPLDLVTVGRTNALSIGIELLSLPKPTSKVFSPAQYASLAWLLVERGKANKIDPHRETVLGHSDTNPLRRCTAQGSYDPGFRFSWNDLWDLITAKPAT